MRCSKGSEKRGGLAGTGLGGAHHVTALQHRRELACAVDRGHGLVAHFSHGTGQGRGQLQLGKGHRQGIGGQVGHLSSESDAIHPIADCTPEAWGKP